MRKKKDWLLVLLYISALERLICRKYNENFFKCLKESGGFVRHDVTKSGEWEK